MRSRGRARIIATISIPDVAWKYMEAWEIAIYAYSLLLAFCGVLIAYWISSDEYEIESLRCALDQMRESIRAIEEKKPQSI